MAGIISLKFGLAESANIRTAVLKLIFVFGFLEFVADLELSSIHFLLAQSTNLIHI
jgi:hypothetical protein